MAPTLNDEKPEVGDLIEILRTSYQHWAVYVGDGFIVDFAPPADSDATSLSLVAQAKPKKAKLLDVVGNDKWKINNSLDEKYKPHPAQVILKDACAKVGEEMTYRLLRWNCEHFATEMRYGKAVSRQVCKFASAFASIVDPMGVVSLSTGCKEENN